MTLRMRLVTAVAAVALIVIAAFAVIVVRQHKVLLEPLDHQLVAVAENLPQADAFFDADESFDMAGLGPPTGELYVAIHRPNAAPQVLARPATDPAFRPTIDIAELASRESPGEPFSIDAPGGGGARVVARELPSGGWGVAALSTATVESAQRDLLITAAVVLASLLILLGLVQYLVDRLGIKPIVDVTHAAEQLATTRSEPRVDVRAPNTEAGRLGTAFNAMVDSLHASDSQQRRFVADASHELRTPLTTLQGYAALYNNGALTTNEDVDDAMRRIGSEAKRMGLLVDELLTLASLDEGRPLTKVNINLNRLLHDLASDAAAIQPDRNITVAIQPDVYICADLELLTQALTTTIRNAQRHTPTSAGLAVRAVRNAHQVRIDIADQGPGIDPEHVEHIFDRFYRPHTTGGRPAGGTGLGLAIAKSIIEAHHGTIRASSSRAGTTIVFTLPHATPHTPDLPT